MDGHRSELEHHGNNRHLIAMFVVNLKLALITIVSVPLLAIVSVCSRKRY